MLALFTRVEAQQAARDLCGTSNKYDNFEPQGSQRTRRKALKLGGRGALRGKNERIYDKESVKELNVPIHKNFEQGN